MPPALWGSVGPRKGHLGAAVRGATPRQAATDGTAPTLSPLHMHMDKAPGRLKFGLWPVFPLASSGFILSLWVPGAGP